MFITIAVIAYNEENTIKNILDDISRQDYDHSLMEVVLVDSASTDGKKAENCIDSMCSSCSGSMAYAYNQN